MLALLLLLVSTLVFTVHGRTSNLEGQSAHRRAKNHPLQEVVSFSSDEENFLLGQQTDTAEILAGRMPGKSARDIQRRCIQLGLRCGGNEKAPEHNSEKWRRRTSQQK